MAIIKIETDDDKKRAIDIIQGQPLTPIMEVTLQEYKKRPKTAKQRKYFHKIVSLMSEYTGEDFEDCKMRIKFMTLPLRELNLGGQRLIYPISSEKANVKQYNKLIEYATIEAMNNGVVIPTPNDYDL